MKNPEKISTHGHRAEIFRPTDVSATSNSHWVEITQLGSTQTGNVNRIQKWHHFSSVWSGCPLVHSVFWKTHTVFEATFAAAQMTSFSEPHHFMLVWKWHFFFLAFRSSCTSVRFQCRSATWSKTTQPTCPTSFLRYISQLSWLLVPTASQLFSQTLSNVTMQTSLALFIRLVLILDNVTYLEVSANTVLFNHKILLSVLRPLCSVQLSTVPTSHSLISPSHSHFTNLTAQASIQSTWHKHFIL